MNSFIAISVAVGCFKKLLRMKSLIIPASLMISSGKYGNKKEKSQK